MGPLRDSAIDETPLTNRTLPRTGLCNSSEWHFNAICLCAERSTEGSCSHTKRLEPFESRNREDFAHTLSVSAANREQSEQSEQSALEAAVQKAVVDVVLHIVHEEDAVILVGDVVFLAVFELVVLDVVLVALHEDVDLKRCGDATAGTYHKFAVLPDPYTERKGDASAGTYCKFAVLPVVLVGGDYLLHHSERMTRSFSANAEEMRR